MTTTTWWEVCRQKWPEPPILPSGKGRPEGLLQDRPASFWHVHQQLLFCTNREEARSVSWATDSTSSKSWSQHIRMRARGAKWEGDLTMKPHGLQLTISSASFPRQLTINCRPGAALFAARPRLLERPRSTKEPGTGARIATWQSAWLRASRSTTRRQTSGLSLPQIPTPGKSQNVKKRNHLLSSWFIYVRSKYCGHNKCPMQAGSFFFRNNQKICFKTVKMTKYEILSI